MDKENGKMALEIAKILIDKKAIDVKILYVAELTIVADYFIIASGTSTAHVKALCDEIEEKLTLKGINLNHVEGYKSARWILMDYGGVIVHIFMKEEREFYSLERLWGDAKEVLLDNLVLD